MTSLQQPGLLREQAYIAGAWRGADDGAVLDVTNPSTGERIARVPNMGAGEARAAIEAAHTAFATWRKTTAKERARLLRNWFELIMARQEELAALMTREQGKPLAEARGEIAYAASFVEWFAEQAKRIDGDVIPSPNPDQRLVVTKEPVGVCAAITPWNFPAAMITRKAAPALAAGCTIVIKPANETPLSAFALAALAEEAGIPAGVVNVVTGKSREIGAEMTSSPLVKKLTFTGSTEVGRLLMRQCSDTVKKMSLELGGNAPFIVFDDADLERAVEGALLSKYRNAGQTCVCANRFFVHDAVYDEFCRRFAERVAAFHVGDGFDAGVNIGPLINEAARDKVDGLVRDAVAQGARVLVGGAPHARGGNFYAPTVLADAKPGMAVLSEEIFGPVAPIVRFTSDDEVVRLANDSIYGLAAYFYSRDIGRVWRVAEQLEYGIVGINSGLISNEVAPFGGVKQSGIGREGSKYGIEDFLSIKYLCMGGVSA
ncbi:NAD-dependent succinate-semialdehyde dehydrogenase [Burkholderia multivorans]|uniref:Succinate-semialdehyde dehydrogenase [NADP+] (Ssdh) n=1 Tax=Burkholderia multivorans CGD2 TaxID=513052 RepID=B9BPB9_9BURK|nr:NAD-dependent succinate-semialdehyde dehydrogenase [Burkholderia multivorans]EEE07437.1 succinate-semialdehyde dehydrogenase [NADP+] (ssdh) [Burkholderia multivorans CGD2]EEE13808.1 succinate-semialdehyde dehydrogenase [NADP+] (ssdh) [Burkholderia multivorans CGD2M]MCA8142834.1 NAD-dependent succinate-semialdehyde dehydrogenase [Burkholderia multivorans]WVN04548.1 NAD-dependent succinate-semialdehyde dehydrogenase [Burkholderia multivorans]